MEERYNYLITDLFINKNFNDKLRINWVGEFFKIFMCNYKCKCNCKSKCKSKCMTMIKYKGKCKSMSK